MNGSLSLRNRINATVRDIPRSGIRDFFDIVTTMKDVIVPRICYRRVAKPLKNKSAARCFPCRSRGSCSMRG